MTLPTDGNAPLNNPSHLTEHQRVSDALALLVTTPWIALPFQTGWANFGAPFEFGAYRKVGDVVQLQGLVGGPIGATTIATLPVGFRPKRQHIFLLGNNGNSSVMRVDVWVDGTVATAGNPVAGGWITLSGVTFSTTGL